MFAVTQEHDGKKEDKPPAANDVRLNTVSEDHEPTSSSGLPMFTKPGAAKPKGSEYHTSVNRIRLKNHVRFG